MNAVPSEDLGLSHIESLREDNAVLRNRVEDLSRELKELRGQTQLVPGGPIRRLAPSELRRIRKRAKKVKP